MHGTPYRLGFLAVSQSPEVRPREGSSDVQVLFCCKWFKLDSVNEVVRFPRNMQRWRLEFGADDLMTNFSIDEQTLKQLYPHGYHGVDKEFRPVYIERIGKTDMAKVLGTFDLNDLIRFHVRQWEILYTQQFPAIQKAAGRQVEQTICIIDLDGVSFGSISQARRRGRWVS